MPAVGLDFLLPSYVDPTSGYQDSIIPPKPAAGASFKRTIPGDFWEIPAMVFAQLTTTATVATRFVRLKAFNGDGVLVGLVNSINGIPANGTNNVTWSLTYNAAFATGTSPGFNDNIPLFPFVLPSGFSIQITVDSMQVGDQLSSIVLTMRRYPTSYHLDEKELAQLEPLDLSHLGVISAAPALAAVQPSAASPSPSPSPTPTPTPTQPVPSSGGAVLQTTPPGGGQGFSRE